jgi:hypothetical protein
MAVMQWKTKLAVEALINFTTVLYLGVFMLLAKEAARGIHEVLQFIKHALLNAFLLRARHELFESLTRVVSRAPRRRLRIVQMIKLKGSYIVLMAFLQAAFCKDCA